MKVPLTQLATVMRRNGGFRHLLQNPAWEKELDNLAYLAACACQMPVAFITLLDGNCHWVASAIGLSKKAAHRYRRVGSDASWQEGLLIIPDLRGEPGVRQAVGEEAEIMATGHEANNQPSAPTCRKNWHQGIRGLRFYAGCPLIGAKGDRWGVLSVMDAQPRQLSEGQQRALQTVADQVVLHLMRQQMPASEAKSGAVLPGAGFERLELAEPVMDVAGRLHLEQESHTQGQVASILDSITDGFFSLDEEFRITYVNDRAQRLCGESQEQLIGVCLWEKFPELMGTLLQESCQRSLRDKVKVEFDFLHPLSEVWWEVRISPTPQGLSVYFRDVTDSKQKQAMTEEKTHLWALGGAVGIALAQGGPLAEVLERCTNAAVEHLGAISARIWTCNNGMSAYLEAASGLPTSPENVAGEASIIDFIASNQEPACGRLRLVCGQLKAISSQIGWKDSYLGSQKEQKQGDGFFTGIPLIVEQRTVGVLALYHQQPFSSDVRSMLEWVAHSLAIAIDRVWAREALLKRREGLLFRLASQIRNSLDLNTILETAVHEIRNLLQIDRCHFLWYLPHPESPSLMVTHEARNEDLPSLLSDCPPQHIDFLASKIQNMEVLRVDDLESDMGLDASTTALLTSLGMTSQLLLPLETRSGQLGAVVCSHCSGARPWSDSEVELLQAVVNQLAIAIDQAELYAQTHAAALAAQTQAQQLSEALHNLKQTQAQLVQSEKMSSLGQMVAGVAHEINNPVNFIYGNITYANSYIKDILTLIELYQQHYPNPVAAIQERLEDVDLEFIIEDLPRILSSMEMGADRIRQIVLSLRNFSRLDEAEKKLVNIHEGIDNTLLILHNRLKPKGNNSGIQVIKDYGTIPRVECYAGQINQVFMNILSNAIDALETQSDPRIITITTQLVNDRGEPLPASAASETGPKTGGSTQRPNLVIRIKDTGSGMTEDVKQHLFDPFFTTKPVGKGTGLGLSISYQIVVEKHGGMLRCFSELGQGSEFCIQIPL